MTDHSIQDKLLVKADEAAAMLGVGRSTLYTMVSNGSAPAPVKIGTMTRWKVADLQQHVQAMQTTRSSTPGAD